MKQCTCFALKATNCICAEREDENSFAHWFYGAPHRIKYLRDHPVFLAAQEAWDAAKKQEAEKQEQGEPVYQIKDYDSDKGWQDVEFSKYETAPEAKRIVYTTPQQRTWVGLTEEEVIDLWPDLIMHRHTYQFWQNLEAKLKEKNT